ETVDNIHINIEYYTGIFKPATIQRLAAHLKNSVKAVINNPDAKLDDILIISEREKQQLLYEFNDTSREYPADKTIHQLFEEQVDRSPDNVSAVGGFSLPIGFPGGIHESTLQRTVPIPYRQLNREANRIALYLHDKKGIKPGDRVGVLMSRSLNQLPAILGILKAGAVYIPLAPDLPQE
ncbi:MAG: AMP-binding protein, partial [bacterium]|nr:AMP-binding protein [bacterium]